ncbi:MAG TPA: hypothetical protein VKB78_04220 [Pirellulales bacterium]|nr:hypothetical protein [Pirellulales bacterium]
MIGDRVEDFLLRLAAVAAQAATILVTWPLWQVRHPIAAIYQSPMLPAFPLPQFDLGWLLLISLAVVLIAPRWGVPIHAGMLIWAIMLDQIRLQVQCISLVILMASTLGVPSLKTLARAHLIALWFYAGFHKLVSPDYYESVIPFMTGFTKGSVPLTWQIVGIGVAVFEVLLAVLAAIPSLRRLCSVLAVGFHLAIVSILAVRLHWNESVCPWNAALAVASVTLLWRWRTSLHEDWRGASNWLRGAIAAVLLSPLLFYVGLIDPFLAYCVYANNSPTAAVYIPGGGIRTLSDTIPDPSLNVPIPPEHRLFEAYFEQIAMPGEVLIIDDPRWCARFWGYYHREIVKKPPPKKATADERRSEGGNRR